MVSLRLQGWQELKVKAEGEQSGTAGIGAPWWAARREGRRMLGTWADKGLQSLSWNAEGKGPPRGRGRREGGGESAVLRESGLSVHMRLKSPPRWREPRPHRQGLGGAHQWWPRGQRAERPDGEEEARRIWLVGPGMLGPSWAGRSGRRRRCGCYSRGHQGRNTQCYPNRVVWP